MHSCKENSDISLSKEFQRHLSKEHRKRGVVDQVKYRKRAIKRKLTDRKYHVQDNADIAHKYVKIYCDTNQFPTLTFCGPHPKPRRERGVSLNSIDKRYIYQLISNFQLTGSFVLIM